MKCTSLGYKNSNGRNIHNAGEVFVSYLSNIGALGEEEFATDVIVGLHQPLTA